MSRVPRAGLTDRQRFGIAVANQRAERLMAGPVVRQRITIALDFRGLYGPEVDRACGVEEPVVDLWESGDLVPTPEQVAALAVLTGFPVAYFYRPVEPRTGVAFVCRGGRRADRCQRYDLAAYDAEREAEIRANADRHLAGWQPSLLAGAS